MANPNLLGITNVKARVLYSAQLVSGDTALYTAGASESVILNPVILCNTSASAVTVSAGIIPSGGTADGTHRAVSGLSIAAGETVVLDEFAGQYLEAGAFLNVNAGTGAAVDATLTGLVVS